MKALLLSIVLISASFGQWTDDFDSYIAGQMLACQNPTNWNTWSGTACIAGIDPLISTEYSLSGPNSVVIIQNNDLVGILNKTSGTWFVHFYFYIPQGKSGYFNILSDFTFAIGGYWAMECYFDIGGAGRLIANHVTTNFTFNHDTWNSILVRINLSNDEAAFALNGNHILIWPWTQGSSTGWGPLAIDVIDFYGGTPDDQMYVDNFEFTNPCLSCYPPFTPDNLNTSLNFSPDPQVELNWQDNSFNESSFIIIRKNGLPGSSGQFNSIGNVNSDITHFTDTNVMSDSTYTYGVIAYNIYGYSDTSNFSSITIIPVPVELISFTVRLNSLGKSVLNWSTASEINNRGFEIERKSIDGQFETIGFVEGYGTTIEKQNYVFIDKSVKQGIYYYRLKQIDFDGNFEYSDVAEVDIAAPSFSLSQNYPNPFNPVTKIKYSIPNVETGHAPSLPATLKVYDVLGKEVATLVNEEKLPGVYEIGFNPVSGIRDLASGIYYYQLKAGDFIETKKMIYLK